MHVEIVRFLEEGMKTGEVREFEKDTYQVPYELLEKVFLAGYKEGLLDCWRKSEMNREEAIQKLLEGIKELKYLVDSSLADEPEKFALSDLKNVKEQVDKLDMLIKQEIDKDYAKTSKGEER